MFRKVFCVALAIAVACAPAFAGDNWVDQFLRRYKPGMLTLAANRPADRDSLPTLVRNGVIPLSINDLINITLENNLDIAVQRLTPIETAYGIVVNNRPFEPMLHIGGTLKRDTQQSTSQLTGLDPISSLTHSYSAGYGQTLKTGADIAIDFSMNRSSTTAGVETYNPSWYASMRYSYTQRFLNGFGSKVNTRAIRVAQNNKTISEVQFERQVIDLITQAQKTYWDLVFTAEDLQVKKASLELAQKTLKDNQTQVDAGVMAKIDLVQAELQVATRNEELLVSNFTQTQIEDQVKKLLSTQPDPGLVLARLSPTQPVTRPQTGDFLPVEAAIRVALENRPELRQANLQLRNSEIDIEYSKNQLLPNLDFNAIYTQNGVGGRQIFRSGFGPTAPIISETPGGLGDALSQLIRSNIGGYVLGVSLQIPLSNKARQAEYAQVSVQKQTAEQNIKAIEQQIVIEVRNAITQMDMTKARIETAERSRTLAEEQYNAEQKKFELGASTIRFVLEEQRNVEQAQSNDIAARVNYAKALVDYDRAIGVTLKKNNVAIDKTLAALK